MLFFALSGFRIEGTYGISSPSLQFWFGCTLMMVIDVIFGLMISSILYYYVLPTNLKQTSISKSNIYVLGFGVIIPCCYLLPYALIDATGIQNSVVRFTLSVPMVLYAFRCVEAMCGFVPPVVTSSPLDYAIYYATPTEFMFDRKNGQRVMATSQDIRRSLIGTTKTLITILILMSLFSPYNYEPFQSMNAREESLSSIRDYLDMKHLGNCLITAMMFQQLVGLFGSATALAIEVMTGYRAVESMRNPVMEATSPSDFWGRRWNVAVHGALKRGVFKPVRKFSSSFVAALMAFIASGLFHEYLVHLTVMYNKEPRVADDNVCNALNTDYKPQLGSNMAFFAWNGVIMVTEKLLGRNRVMQSFGSTLPRFMVVFLTIMTALPLAHWFGNPYIKQGLLCDFQEGYFFVTKIA